MLTPISVHEIKGHQVAVATEGDEMDRLSIKIEKVAKELGAKARANGEVLAAWQEYTMDHLAEATIIVMTRKS